MRSAETQWIPQRLSGASGLITVEWFEQETGRRTRWFVDQGAFEIQMESRQMRVHRHIGSASARSGHGVAACAAWTVWGEGIRRFSCGCQHMVVKPGCRSRCKEQAWNRGSWRGRSVCPSVETPRRSSRGGVTYLHRVVANTPLRLENSRCRSR